MARRATSFDRLVGERIRDVRLFRGMTQADLGARVGARFQQIFKYETGIDRVSASMLFQISVALDVSVDDLCSRAPTKNGRKGVRRSDVTGAPQTKETMLLVRYALRLPREGRRKLLHVFKEVVEICAQPKRS